ncbi:MAG: hypothetical protein LBK82_08920 [Planctomycetaceae bacterium]|nr:hypothetical protein [Planctomycetaceae bacterium]
MLRNFQDHPRWFDVARKKRLKANDIKKYIFNNLNNVYDFTLDGEYSFFLKLPIVYDDKTGELIFVSSSAIKLTVDSRLVDLSKVIQANLPRVYSKSSHGVSISLVTDKQHYEDYGPVYLNVATKNVSDGTLSMIVDGKNVFDVYELVLLTPGDNLDFRKPAAEDKSDVQKVAFTLYGKKLLAEKSKTPKPTVAVNSNEETAESVIVLNRIFDMSTDGIYGLIVTRKIIDSTGKEQTVSSEPFPIRIGWRSTKDEVNAKILEQRLYGNDPDYPMWQSRDGIFQTPAKLISVDKNTVTLEKPDGKQTTFNLSDLQKENQDYIKKQTAKNSSE